MGEEKEMEKKELGKAAEKTTADEAGGAKETKKVAEKQGAANMIEKANLVALRQEEANKKFEELLNRQEAMKVEATLGGTADAGIPAEKDENEGARKMLEGTGYDEMLFPKKQKT